jgi:lysophospholipase L1-like esterase
MIRTAYFIGHSHIELFEWGRRFPEYEVHNFGVAGETVEGLLKRLDAVINLRPSPEIIFIQTGGNNASVDDLGFMDSYRVIVSRLSDAFPRARIIMSTLLPCVFELVSQESIQKANALLRDFASESGTEMLDSYHLFIGPGGKVRDECFLPDGVHLNDKGYRIWSESIEDIICNNH